MVKSRNSLLSSILRVGFIFFVAVLFLLVVFSAIMLITIRGKEVEAPDVVGKSFIEAVQILNKHRLGTPIIEGEKYSGDVPQGYVIEQRPEPGHKVKVGREIKVFVSKGAEAGIVPRIVGQTISEAQIALQALGLEIGSIVRIHSDDFPQEGIIIAHTPPPNAAVQKGTKVNLLLSLGPFLLQLVMPDIRGMKLQDAEELLKSRGLKLGLVEREFSLEVEEADIILEQTPQPNDRIKRGTSVNVIVSSLE